MERTLNHKRPCKSCPFLKTSKAGYFGHPDNNAELYSNLAHSESGVRCHTSEFSGKNHHCVGSLQHANATGKLYQSEEMQIAQKMVGKNPNILGFEFLEYHGTKDI